METQYVKQYSPALDRDMECKIYGRAGRPVLYIPCQDGRFFDFESIPFSSKICFRRRVVSGCSQAPWPAQTTPFFRLYRSI